MNNELIVDRENDLGVGIFAKYKNRRVFLIQDRIRGGYALIFKRFDRELYDQGLEERSHGNLSKPELSTGETSIKRGITTTRTGLSDDAVDALEFIFKHVYLLKKTTVPKKKE